MSSSATSGLASPFLSSLRQLFDLLDTDQKGWILLKGKTNLLLLLLTSFVFIYEEIKRLNSEYGFKNSLVKKWLLAGQALMLF